MHRIPRHCWSNVRRYSLSRSPWDVTPGCSQLSRAPCPGSCHPFTRVSQKLPHLKAPGLQSAKEAGHVRRVAEELQQNGILKISLEFPDPNSQYLTQLVLSLHEHHGHQLPISHSATRGWFWDVRPSVTRVEAGSHQARSETMNDFPWHTDACYEDPPPRHFALHVLQHDRLGGGTLSLLNVQQLTALLSPESRVALTRPEYRITIPPEFIKDAARQHIVGSLLVVDEKDGQSGDIMCFREDILAPLSQRAARALDELKRALQSVECQESVLHLTSGDLPEASVVLVDNGRWLHARNEVKDPGRHLRRVRWNAVPFRRQTH